MSKSRVPDCENCLKMNELKILYEISSVMNKAQALEERLEESLELLQKYLHLAKSTVYTYDEQSEMLRIFVGVGLTKQQKIIASYKIGEGATGVAAKSKEPVIVENVHNNILFLNKTGSRSLSDISYVAVPMIIEGVLLGVLGANITKDSKMSFDDTIKVLTIVSTIFAQSKFAQKQIDDEKKKLSEQAIYYKTEMLKEQSFESIIGESACMKRVFEIISKVANSKATVLVRGETGTGKELIASAIHNKSNRKEGPYIKLNCAAIPENLLESELFGHEKGAFTDAVNTRKGRFELADNGTLFLDEIGDISSSLQVKLLRVLQEQEFERVGGSKSIKVDVRIVAATNRNLEQMVREGKFREDLFYRLNVIPIQLPPLRERDGDVKLLTTYFFQKFSKIHKEEITPSERILDAFGEYSWPGNIRELENTVERAILLWGNGNEEDILNMVLPSTAPKPIQTAQNVESKYHYPKSKGEILTKDDMDNIEKEQLLKALNECGGVQIKAAEKLGITNRQLGYKIKKYALVKTRLGFMEP